MRKPSFEEIVKTYPTRGPLQQYRLSLATAFQCFRCGEEKKAKLITLYRGDWEKTLCNGCYGFLLSVWEIKRGHQDDGEKAEALADLLLSIYNKNKISELEKIYEIRDSRARHISDNSLRFLATSEHLAENMPEDLDWSPVIIGLCKAFETEVTIKILYPLSKRLSETNLSIDKSDKDLGRIAKFLSGEGKAPEMGTFAHFLQTLLNSISRRSTSQVVKEMFNLFQDWPRSSWISDINGLYTQITKLTRDFRNRAAHTEVLTRADYEACRELVIGDNGMLWKLALTTQRI